MKKHIILSALVFVITVTFVFAQKRETRNVDTFSKIAFRVPGNLYLRQGNTQKVELEGDKAVLDEIDTKIEGRGLVIERKGRWNNWSWGSGDKINVYITVKNIDAVSVSGSGDLIGETKFTTGDLEVKVSGSGSLKMEVESSGEIEADVSGSGSITLKGTCKSYNSDVSGSGRVSLNINVADRATFGVSGSGKIEAAGSASSVKASISGSGKVLASNLETNSCDVRISGSGDVEINVKNELDATISGSGSVSYKGNPSKVNSHSSGSGKVRKM